MLRYYHPSPQGGGEIAWKAFDYTEIDEMSSEKELRDFKIKYNKKELKSYLEPKK